MSIIGVGGARCLWLNGVRKIFLNDHKYMSDHCVFTPGSQFITNCFIYNSIYIITVIRLKCIVYHQHSQAVIVGYMMRIHRLVSSPAEYFN